MTSYLRVTRASGLWWVGHAAIHASYHFLQQLPCPEIALCKARIVVCQIISWKHYSMMARAPSRWSDRPVKRIDAAEVRVIGGTCDQSSDWRSCGMRGIQEGCLPAGEGGGARRKSDIGLSAGRAVWIRFCPNPSPTEPGRQSRETFRTQTGGSRRSAHERRCM